MFVFRFSDSSHSITADIKQNDCNRCGPENNVPAVEHNDSTLSLHSHETVQQSVSGLDSNREECDEQSDNIQPFLSTKRLGMQLPSTEKFHISSTDHLLASLARSIRFHTPYEQLIYELKWLNCTKIYPSLPKSKRELWFDLSRNDSNLIHHVYCRYSLKYLGIKRKACNVRCSSDSCQSLKLDLSYFVQVKLYPQILELLSIPTITESLKYRYNRKKSDINTVEDIYDGIQYQKLSSANGFLDKWYNMSFTLNTNGAQVSNSSNASCWPIYLQINELPPHLRKRHMLLAGVYCDIVKPPMNALIGECLSELRQLYTEGIQWVTQNGTNVISKFVVLVCSVNSMARAPLLRMTQFNGDYGCTFCYARGVRNPENPLAKYYPADENAKLRTDEEIRTDMRKAVLHQKKSHGVDGISAIASLPLFDLAKGTVVDSMHAVFLGVVKHHTKLLLTSTNTPWYIGSAANLQLIAGRLGAIHPPNRISKTPRSITTWKQWKASEWRNWLLYYSLPCLHGILPLVYLKHLSLLVQAIYNLSQESITPQEMDQSEALLTKFVHRFEELFGISHMTFNLHLLTHLIETVRNWGPLWVHTTFAFESWNKRIIDMVTSPKDRVLQIAVRFLMLKFISGAIHDETVAEETRQHIFELFPSFEAEMVSVAPRQQFKGIGEALIAVKPYIQQYMDTQGYSAVKQFQKSKIHGIEYRRSDYKPGANSSNCHVYCSAIGFGTVEDIVELVRGDTIVQGISVDHSCI